jgi:beta-carotene 15,15'-dioxygenase
MDLAVASTAAARVVAACARWSRGVAAAVALGGAALAAAPGPGPAAAVLLLVAAGLLAGLPHGAIDHRVAAALTGRPVPVVAAGYAALALATWVLLVVTGPVALVAVLLLSVAHFGLGELETVRATTGWRPRGAVAVAVAVAATGALLLPLARSGAQLAAVAAAVSPPLGVLLGDAAVRLGLALLWGVAAVVAAAAALRARRAVVVLDLLLVGALGAFAPPLLAFAAWFGGWHALRHAARLTTVEPECAALLARGQPLRAVGALLRLAAWPTAAAVLVLAVLLAATAAAADPVAAVGGTLLVLLALTVPHMVVVLWLDRRGGGPAGRGQAPPSRTSRSRRAKASG